MGHSDIRTTTIYLAASAEHLRRQITKYAFAESILRMRRLKQSASLGILWAYPLHPMVLSSLPLAAELRWWEKVRSDKIPVPLEHPSEKHPLRFRYLTMSSCIKGRSQPARKKAYILVQALAISCGSRVFSQSWRGGSPTSVMIYWQAMWLSFSSRISPISCRNGFPAQSPRKREVGVGAYASTESSTSPFGAKAAATSGPPRPAPPSSEIAKSR